MELAREAGATDATAHACGALPGLREHESGSTRGLHAARRVRQLRSDQARHGGRQRTRTVRLSFASRRSSWRARRSTRHVAAPFRISDGRTGVSCDGRSRARSAARRVRRRGVLGGADVRRSPAFARYATELLSNDWLVFRQGRMTRRWPTVGSRASLARVRCDPGPLA
jgi:hypothetical protein